MDEEKEEDQPDTEEEFKEEVEEVKEEAEVNWVDLIPQPKTALSANKKRGGGYQWGRYVVSYPWREDEKESHWKKLRLGSEMLDMFSAAPSAQEEAVASEIDIDVSNTRLEEVHELIQHVIDRQLEEEELLGPDGDQRVPPGKYRRCAYDLEAAPSASSGAKEEDDAAGSSRSVSGTQKQQKLPTYKELSLQRWKTCSDLASALLLLQLAGTDWDRVRCVRTNAVHGNPHKRALNRILARYTEGYPQSQTGERECVKPDISSVPDEVMRVKSDEVIFTVSVCDSGGSKQQEFDILGSQSLHDLKDAFYFVSDWMYDGPTRVDSGCMCIGGWFFSDLRSEHSVDYAPELMAHLFEQRPEMEHLKSGILSMNSLIKEITIPFGVQCCYVRQGDIEHPMYFTNVRKFNPSCDCPFEEAYPILTHMQTFYKRYCSACAQNQATWVVHGSTRVPVDPLYICYPCFNHFFKDQNGELLKPVDYTVFPYLHD